jgi:glycosyltransferase involved in cell wall biosynthesis
MPTFNRCQQLPHAIASVLQQTKPVDEMIIVDDGSTDGTFEMLTELAARTVTPHIVPLRQENLGPAAARNAGIKNAAGELVAFLDDDDIWHPDKLARQLAILDASPGLALLGCATDTLKLPGGSRLVAIGEWKLLVRNWFLTPGVIARRDVVLHCGGFPEDMRHCEDYALWLRIASGHQCAFLNEVLVSCGHGKPTFGHSGLSADLAALYAGEMDALARWSKQRNAGMAMSALAEAIAGVRHLRRRIVAARYQTG